MNENLCGTNQNVRIFVDQKNLRIYIMVKIRENCAERARDWEQCIVIYFLVHTVRQKTELPHQKTEYNDGIFTVYGTQ